MTHKITTESMVGYLQCPRKAFLLLHTADMPSLHPYEIILAERAAANRVRYVTGLSQNGIHGATSITDAEGGITTSNAVSVPSPTLVASCDALTRSPSSSGKNQTTYEPHLAIGTHSILMEQKLALAFAGYVAGQVQRHLPTIGFIVPYLGTPRRVKLQAFYPRVRLLVSRLREFAVSSPSELPPLELNQNCLTCAFREQCLREAERNDCLSLLERITPRLSQRYARKGIFTVTQLSHVFKPRRRRRAGKRPLTFNVEIQALAIRTNKVYLHEPPSIPLQPVEIYLDIEGIPDQGFQYLIGLLVCDNGTITFRSFWASSPEDESRILRECSEACAKHPTAPIYHYGSYEPRAIQHSSRKHGVDCSDLLHRLVNVNSLIFGKVYFPSRSNRLKDLGQCVGATWSAPDASGINSLVWRYRWEDGLGDKYRDMLLTYNREDCNALHLLVAELRNLAEAAESRSDVDFFDRPKHVGTPTGEVIHRAFDGILKSAHAEYHRRRIAIAALDEAENTPEENAPARFRVSPIAQRNISATGGKIIRVASKRICPRHRKRRLESTDEVVSHSVIDLAFTKSGCRKVIIRFVGKRAYCPMCGVGYLPPALRRMQGRIFGHAFQAWAVYQRIALRMPYSAVGQVIDAIFSEHVNDSSISGFVRQFAEEYAGTESLLLERLLEGRMIHVDETKLNIQGSNQYAWVLTDGVHVVFRLTETRETACIQALLSGYDGVLVSDFYSGYDAMGCRQQKCLVHLIRDLNDDLWKNPFNEEYEIFVAAVRDLLVPMFKDVNRYGLRAWHLRKHLKAVARFYRQSIERAESQCELVHTYRKRFTRYREALFRFLSEDGIPWNNNTAERALRHLAIQRKISGSLYKTGAVDYLRLLGIAQTCRFQGKAFLKFLLSGERDVDKFADRARIRSSLPHRSGPK